MTFLRPLIHLARLSLTALLVLALLWAQMLGQVHSVRHVHEGWVHVAAPMPVRAQTGATPANAQVDIAHAHHAAFGVLAHLQTPDGEAQDCRLYDQLGHGGPVSAQFGLQVHALPLVPAWVVLQALQPRPCVAFAARAPPVFR